uniref:Uncharacterized protein n=1 Tax=viral metagenome TaxID=1070528 RepID=A0A6M3L2J5_9ZZZZ
MAVVSWDITIGGNVYRGSASYTEHTKQLVAVATGTSDSGLNFGGVTTATVVLVNSDQNISVDINASAETAKSVLANRPLLLTGTAATAIYVTNASGSTANVTFEIWGA